MHEVFPGNTTRPTDSDRYCLYARRSSLPRVGHLFTGTDFYFFVTVKYKWHCRSPLEDAYAVDMDMGPPQPAIPALPDHGKKDRPVSLRPMFP
jgi:hypothetical protein